MGTTFTVTATKGNGVRYEIDLGVNILEGKTPEQVYAMAEDSAIVGLQNRKGSLLRTANGEADVEDILSGFGYTGATVAVYVERPKTVKPITTADIKRSVDSGRITKEQLMAMIDEMDDNQVFVATLKPEQ